MKKLDYLPKTDLLIVLALAVGFIHHVDHVLRFDHSGWPFKENITLFSYSLLVYPIMLWVLAAKTWHKMRLILTSLVFTAVQSAHTFIETPCDQYRTWATGFGSDGAPNLLSIQSSLLGLTAAGVSILLSLLLVLTLLAMWRDIRNARVSAG